MTTEIWKPIKDFEGLYEVSNKGNIRNAETKVVLKQRKNNRGYCILELYKDFKKKTALVHRLVCEAFLEIPEDLKDEKRLQVNHIDGIKDHNELENLEWCDQSHNMKESYRLGLRKYVPYEVTEEYREKMRKSSSKPSPGKEVQMIDMKTGEILGVYESATKAAHDLKDLNLKDSGIRDAANGRRGLTSYKGYIWKFTGNISNGAKCRESKKK